MAYCLLNTQVFHSMSVKIITYSIVYYCLLYYSGILLCRPDYIADVIAVEHTLDVISL